MTFKQRPLFQYYYFFRCLKTVLQDAPVILATLGLISFQGKKGKCLSRSSYNYKINLFYSKANRSKELTETAR